MNKPENRYDSEGWLCQNVIRLVSKAGLRKKGLSAGDPVKMIDGAYAGLRGKVEKPGKAFSWVSLPGFPNPLKVAAHYLLIDNQNSDNQCAA